MDQGPLVENQIDEGTRLVALLVERGFDVTAAFWVRPSGDAQWTLTIASRLFDEQGPLAAYRAISSVLPRTGDDWVSMSDVKAIGARDPVTKEVLDMLRRYPGPSATRSRRRQLGGMDIEEVYVYPPLPLVAPDDPWRGINVYVTKDSDAEETYKVLFWPHESASGRVPDASIKRVPRPASVRVRDGKVVVYRAPEKPLPHLAQQDYERKAIEAVEQVAAQPL